VKWSWKIAEVAGIGVYMHATFLLLIGFIVLSHWMQGNTAAGTAMGVLFILVLFVCVLLHELGHALTAKRYGIKTRDITLLPIGGLARLERMPDKPVQELWVALAGPAVNVVIGALLFGWLVATDSLVPIGTLGVSEGSFLERLMVVNVFLVAFNLIPAFPMDGGRVLRALLAMRMEYTRATQIAASLGQGIAFVFGFIGFFTNPILLFIAFFVWIGAAQEASMVQMKSSLSGIPVRTAMLTDFKALDAGDPLSQAVDLILAGSQTDFPVCSRGEVVGVLTKSDLLVALARQGQSARVGDVMQKEIQIVEAQEMLEGAFLRLQNCQCRTAPVLDNGRLVGILTMDNVGELVAIQAALGRKIAPQRG
jgi:Zn-dependent protease/CBS domain-containing protein